MNHTQMPTLFNRHRRSGFYPWVIEYGEVGTGDEIARAGGGPEQITWRMSIGCKRSALAMA